MDALKLLKQDHEKVDDLFDKFEETTERAQKTRRMLADRIIHELTIHAAIEEKVFYPAARRADEELGDMVLEAFEEHAIVKRLLSELAAMDSGDERFGAKMKVLSELVRHHVKEEEHDMFPKAKKAFGAERLEELGTRMEEAKGRMQKVEAGTARRRSNGDARDSFVQ